MKKTTTISENNLVSKSNDKWFFSINLFQCTLQFASNKKKQVSHTLDLHLGNWATLELLQRLIFDSGV